MIDARALALAAAIGAAAAPAAAQDPFWGRYAGGTLGRVGDKTAKVGPIDGDLVAGLFVGTRQPLKGGLFWGGEVEASRFRQHLGDGATLDGSLRLKAGFGAARGDWSTWITAGPALGLAHGAVEPGWVAGVGLAYGLSERVRIGAELLRQEYPGAGEGAAANSIGLRLEVSF